MSVVDDGGPAFPHDGRDNGPGNIKGRAHDGMTLRDWFAGQALAGYFAYQWAEHQNTATIDTARYIYQMADAMLAARKGGAA